MKRYIFILIRVWSKFLLKIRGSSIVNTEFGYDSKVESGSNVFNSRFGRHSFAGYNCEISHSEIGSFCSIGNNVILNPGVHPINWVSTSPVFYSGKDSVKVKYANFDKVKRRSLVIGSDVWIGSNVVVMGGVNIGHGAIIGASSVVTKNVPPYAIVGGVPAKILKYRFDENLIEELLQSKWWELDENELKKVASKFMEPRNFLDNF